MTDLELVEKYGKLCRYIAQHFVNNSRYAAYLRPADAEDLTSIAMIGLIKCPQEHRHEKPYINRLITNHIIKGWHKLGRYRNAEHQPPESRSIETEFQDGGDGSSYHDWFDRQAGRDGLAGHTQIKFDAQTVLAILPQLPDAERIVMELSFGLTPGCEPLGLERIARKLGRTKYWAEIRLNKGLSRVRDELRISQ